MKKIFRVMGFNLSLRKDQSIDFEDLNSALNSGLVDALIHEYHVIDNVEKYVRWVEC